MAIFLDQPFTGTHPAYGWGNFNAQEGVYYDSSKVVGGADDGGNYLRTLYRNGVNFSGNPQHYCGVGISGIGTTVTQGMEIFIRTLVYWGNGWIGSENYGGKHMMIGDGAGAGPVSRIIAGVRDNGTTSSSIACNFCRNIDNTDAGTPIVEFAKDTWIWAQYRIRSSTHASQLSSATRSGTTGTVVTTTAHGFVTGNRVEIRGEFNTGDNSHLWEGVYTVTVNNSTTFTCTVNGSAAATATWQATPWAMSANAFLSMHINNSDAGINNPSGQSNTEFGISTIAWSGTTLYGGFNNQTGSVFYNPPVDLRLAHFQLGDTFDPGWVSGGAANFTLIADPGSYVWTGNPATLVKILGQGPFNSANRRMISTSVVNVGSDWAS